MKKLVILLLVFTLLMTPMLAAGATVSGPTAAPTDTFGGTFDTFSVGGAASEVPTDFRWIEQYVFTLPTSGVNGDVNLDMDFLIDPNGLFHLTNEQIDALVLHPTYNRWGNMVDQNWVRLEDAGQIIFPEDRALHFINESNFDLGVSLEFNLTLGGDMEVETNPAAPVLGENTDTTPTIFLAATFNEEVVRGLDAEFDGAVTLPINTSSGATNTAVFHLPAANYLNRTVIIPAGGTYTSTIHPDMEPIVNDSAFRKVVAFRNDEFVPNTGNGNLFALHGLANPSADFTGATATLDIVVDHGRVADFSTTGSFEESTHTLDAEAFGLQQGGTGADFDRFIEMDELVIDLEPPVIGPQIGFMFNDVVDPTRGTAQANDAPGAVDAGPVGRGPGVFASIPFSAAGGEVTLETVVGAAPTLSGHDSDGPHIWLNFAATAPVGWRAMRVTVEPEDGSPDKIFYFWFEVVTPNPTP